ncbi:unnamed protein product [Blepharisma stoltei]|uniref:Uncharacterized protein n=1 Tax=Blepharisma stoltei TaxID=1481888 RepID=A0AAU9JP62_9CILI|nr:unnamed protein product [Blepharisma stoltei]
MFWDLEISTKLSPKICFLVCFNDLWINIIKIPSEEFLNIKFLPLINNNEESAFSVLIFLKISPVLIFQIKICLSWLSIAIYFSFKENENDNNFELSPRKCLIFTPDSTFHIAIWFFNEWHAAI